MNPTESPTDKPTSQPTFYPTETTTAEPTDIPTNEPTTNQPTSNPTYNPTSDPTKDPTVHPTDQPTYNPTVMPTEEPTYNPTHLPTTGTPSMPPTKTILTDAPKTPAPFTPTTTPAPTHHSAKKWAMLNPKYKGGDGELLWHIYYGDYSDDERFDGFRENQMWDADVIRPFLEDDAKYGKLTDEQL